ncbi:MAG TPA: transcriptional repressor LexA [Candidatus Dormibacteraeota bacterium]|nr:transcriptional repressor LexA [Candidatus Dormibacteraeota bacterium]
MTRAQAGQPGNLTKRQKVVFEFIKGYIQTHGVSPSYEEIRRNFGFGSYNSVQKHLKSLVAKGFLKTPWDNQKRALTLVEPGPATAILPLLGRVAAGRPIEAIAYPETVEVPEMLLRGEDNFALRVVGDSMVDEGIRDGDIVIVKRQRDAENGQTVVALIGDDATIKQYYRRGTRVELRPANARVSSIIVDEGDLQVQGIVVGLIRKFHR